MHHPASVPLYSNCEKEDAMRHLGKRVLITSGDRKKSPFILIVAALCLIGGSLIMSNAMPAAAQAIPEVLPGETITFTTATDGATECREGDLPIFACDTHEFLDLTHAVPRDNEVRTNAIITIGDSGLLGIPYYSLASISNDFFIPGSPDTLADVHITVSYDFTGVFRVLGLYTVSNSLLLRVQDRTSGIFVAAHEIENMQRQGDQGFTDMTVGHERAVLKDQKAHFTVKLRRGGLYRLHFQLMTSAGTTLVIAGRIAANATAKWHTLAVTVDEDEVEQLAYHDMRLAEHDLAVRQAIAQQDADIKVLLRKIRDDLKEIKQLLTTPEMKQLIGTPKGQQPGTSLK